MTFEAPTSRANAQPSRGSTIASTARSKLSVWRQPILVLWIFYILLSPFYVFKSGLPQPGDWIVVALVPLALAKWDGRLPKHARGVLRALAWFTCYVVLSAVFWSMATGAWSTKLQNGFLLTPVFYIFNALVLMVALILHRRFGDVFLRITVHATIASIWLQTLLILIASRGGARGKGLFNNPNQLGYFALLSCTILILLQSRTRVRTFLSAATIVAAAYLATVSASKAALIGMAILVGLSFFNRLRSVIFVGVLVAVAITFVPPVRSVIDRAEQRINSDRQQDFLVERGYDRILKYPEYWITGSGEGFYGRFEKTTRFGALELHTSVGTMFFCYGVFGSILFLTFLVRVVRKVPWRQSMALVPAAGYGLVHQSLRFTLLWVVFALLVSIQRTSVDAMRRPPPGH